MTLRDIFSFLNERCHIKYKDLALALDFDPSYISKLINGRYALSRKLFRLFASQSALHYATLLKDEPAPQDLFAYFAKEGEAIDRILLDASPLTNEDRPTIDVQKLGAFLLEKMDAAYEELVTENALPPEDTLFFQGEKAVSFWGADTVHEALLESIATHVNPRAETPPQLMVAVNLASVEPFTYSSLRFSAKTMADSSIPPLQSSFFLKFPTPEQPSALMQPRALATLSLNAINTYRKLPFSVYELPENYADGEGVALDRSFVFHFLKSPGGQLQAAFLSHSETIAELFRAKLLRYQLPSALIMESARIEQWLIPGQISKLCYAPKAYMVSKAFAGLFLTPNQVERYSRSLGGGLYHEFEQTMHSIRSGQKAFDLHIITSYSALIEFVETGRLTFFGRSVELDRNDRRVYLDSLCARLLQDQHIKFHLLHQFQFPGTQGECRLFCFANGSSTLFMDSDLEAPQRLGVALYCQSLQEALMDYFADWAQQAYVDPENREELVSLIRAAARYAWGE